MIKCERPLVLFGIQSELVQRDFVDSGVLTYLKQHVDLCFVVATDKIATSLEPYGTVLGKNRPPPFSRFLWDSSYHANTIFHWERIVGRMGKRWFTRKNQPGWDIRALAGRVAASLGLGNCYARFASLVFGLINWRSMSLHPERSLSLVVVPTTERDLFADELIRYARRVRVPSLGLQLNLDAFNVKASIEVPDAMALWGEQSWFLSRLGATIAPDKLYLLGTPRYENYKKTEKTEARLSIGYDQDAIIFLFAGSTAAFREHQALHEIDLAICEGVLPKNVQIIYKPHPKGQEDKSQENFCEEDFKNVRLYRASTQSRWTALEEYPLLLSAVDAVITPYSTMGLEGALMGLPVLCLGYHEQGYESYWHYARDFFHLRIFYNRAYAIQCHAAAELIPSVSHLVKQVDDNSVSEEARCAAASVVYNDKVSYEKRLKDLILRLINSN